MHEKGTMLSGPRATASIINMTGLFKEKEVLSRHCPKMNLDHHSKSLLQVINCMLRFIGLFVQSRDPGELNTKEQLELSKRNVPF